jgi:site-specific DNA recombinase
MDRRISAAVGYDLDPAGGRLVVNDDEAKQVREIFGIFHATRSIEATLEELNRRGWRTKSWITAKGVRSGGAVWTEGTLVRLLANELYTGWVVYQGKRYRGEHRSIIGSRQWRSVQALLRRRAKMPRAKPNQHGALLQGLLYCGACDRLMRPTYTSRKQHRYRYYACLNGKHPCGNRVSAATMEASVLQQLEYRTRTQSVKTDAVPTIVSPEVTARIRTVVERVTYDRTTGQVSIRLGAKEGKHHGAA